MRFRMDPRPARPPSRDEPWAKYFLIGVCVTVLDLLLYPYLEKFLTPYVAWGAQLLFLALGAAAGYVVAWKRSGGHALWVPTGAVLGLVVGYELGRLDPTITVVILISVAASGLSMGIGALLA